MHRVIKFVYHSISFSFSSCIRIVIISSISLLLFLSLLSGGTAYVPPYFSFFFFPFPFSHIPILSFFPFSYSIFPLFHQSPPNPTPLSLSLSLCLSVFLSLSHSSTLSFFLSHLCFTVHHDLRTGGWHEEFSGWSTKRPSILCCPIYWKSHRGLISRTFRIGEDSSHRILWRYACLKNLDTFICRYDCLPRIARSPKL